MVLRRVPGFFCKKAFCPRELSWQEKKQVILEHTKLAIADKGEYLAMCQMRHHLAWYVKGMPNSAKVRQALSTVATFAELEELLKRYLD